MPFPKDRLVATEYQPFDSGQPPVHFGERTGIQSVITSPWVLRWACIPATYATYRADTQARHDRHGPRIEGGAGPRLRMDHRRRRRCAAGMEDPRSRRRSSRCGTNSWRATLYYGDVDFGYTCFEKIIEPKDGYLKIVRFKPLLHDITEICIGHKGGFIGVRQLGKDLGLANSVHVGFRVEGSYLYGIPLLENARQAYNWWIDCNEGARRYDRKIAGAHIVVEYPVGTSTDRNGKEVENADLARTVLDSLEAAGGVAVPRDMAAFMQQLNLESPGWKIWILDAGSNQQGTFVVRLEYLDKHALPIAAHSRAGDDGGPARHAGRGRGPCRRDLHHPGHRAPPRDGRTQPPGRRPGARPELRPAGRGQGQAEGQPDRGREEGILQGNLRAVARQSGWTEGIAVAGRRQPAGTAWLAPSAERPRRR